MGLVRITSWYPKFNGSHFGLPPISLHGMTGVSGNIVWTMTYSHRPHPAPYTHAIPSSTPRLHFISFFWLYPSDDRLWRGTLSHKKSDLPMCCYNDSIIRISFASFPNKKPMCCYNDSIIRISIASFPNKKHSLRDTFSDFSKGPRSVCFFYSSLCFLCQKITDQVKKERERRINGEIRTRQRRG